MGSTQGRRRRVGRGGLVALVSAVLLVLGASAGHALRAPAGPSAPFASGQECTADTGAFVAVDFGPFGGDVVSGCDPAPTTGYALLHAGGFTTAGTEHDGPAFVCRIGHPSIDSGTQYPTPREEPCVRTPPASAYWSYWVAAPGETEWTYSRHGAMDRTPRPGDVDAWVFGGTGVGGTNGRPSFSPEDVRDGEGGAGPEPSGGPTAPEGRIDVAAAGRWVAGRLVDGERIEDEWSASPDHHLTTEAAFALAASRGEGPELAKVTAYLTGRTDAYAYPAGPDQAPDAGAAGRLALLAQSTGADPRDVAGRDLLGDLVDHVCTAGPESGSPTPGCTAAGDFHGALYTEGQALALLAVVRGGLQPPAGAAARLAALQCGDGSVSSVLIRPGEYCEGDPATTALVALVLRAVGGHGDAVAEARASLRQAQRADGSLLGYPGASAGSVTATAYAAQALRALGETARADAAVAWLATQQRADGGFGFEAGTEPSELYPTAPAVLAGAGTSLVTLTTERPGPSTPPTTPTGDPTPPPSTTPTPTVSAPAPGEVPDLGRGVAYLTGPDRLQQGRYYPAGGGTDRADFGLTIDGAYALAATGLDNATLRAMVDFLQQGGQDAQGRTVHDWTGVGGEHPTAGSLGKTALLAQMVGRDPRDFGGHDLITALAEAVCTAPSAAPDRSCAARGAYTHAPSVFAHSLALVAQVRAGEEEAATEPVAYLLSLQHGHGAWPSLIPDSGDSDVDSTAMAAMALDLVGGPEADRAVDAALEWIAEQQYPDGGFPGAAGNSVNSAALAVQGLSLDADAYPREIADARAFLAAQQNADGGFNVAAQGQRGSDLRASTQAVGGATGASFATLTRSLAGTSPQPLPTPTASTPPILTPGDVGGPGGGGAGGGAGGGTDGTGPDASGGGNLAATGFQVGSLAVAALVSTLAGWRITVVARRRQRAALRERP
ncbi:MULTISPECIES: prenyltransferase/squalene oxidase repeat-containing protein [Streptomyces]|uniref:prenyltransferase/squalene oxidase repeat-containing protein n=1 Tax=Streptomyces TaxID=1883 RepID=UPI0022497D42|nr:prenyltransferase/squalene oxidase repeat-containing protein [Streptomyces sp. JHD 1]MCX2968543.1 peptidase [Streptomyces sp. JHD 1]